MAAASIALWAIFAYLCLANNQTFTQILIIAATGAALSLLTSCYLVILDRINKRIEK